MILLFLLAGTSPGCTSVSQQETNSARPVTSVHETAPNPQAAGEQEAPLHTLREIYRDGDGDGAVDLLGDTVQVTGTANVASGVYHERYLQIYIQNDSTGLSLFAESIAEPVSPGDRLSVRGVVQRYYGLVELAVLDYSIVGQVPADSIRSLPLETVYRDPSPYIGMQVQGSAVVIEKGNRYNGKYLTLASSEDSRGSIMFYVTNFHKNYTDFRFDRVSMGDRVRVSGVVNRYSDPGTPGYFYSIFPRTSEDLGFTGLPRYYLVLALVLLLAVAVVVGIWLVVLRRQVRKQTARLSESLKEKEVLLQEIHHRVKNNLAVISGLIDLQMDATDDEPARRVLQDSQKRIQSMALVHDKLYRSDTITSIGMRKYVIDLVKAIHRTFDEQASTVELNFEVEDLSMDLKKVIPCGLLINELVVNAFKHAFEQGKGGELTIRLKRRNGMARLVIADDGSGLPDDFSLDSSDSLGMMLVQTFAAQLSADVDINGQNGGTHFAFTFPMDDSDG